MTNESLMKVLQENWMTVLLGDNTSNHHFIFSKAIILYMYFVFFSRGHMLARVAQEIWNTILNYHCERRSVKGTLHSLIITVRPCMDKC